MLSHIKYIIDQSTYDLILGSLNKNLIESQEVSDKQLDNIIYSHFMREKMDLIDISDYSKHEIKQFNSILEDIEFFCQENWNFEKNKKFHRWWYNMNECSCPKMDNNDMIGVYNSVINMSCKLHGELY